jgi:hypothetical protein
MVNRNVAPTGALAVTGVALAPTRKRLRVSRALEIAGATPGGRVVRIVFVVVEVCVVVAVGEDTTVALRSSR